MILLSYTFPAGLRAPASCLARSVAALAMGPLTLDPDALTLDRSTLVTMGVGDLVLDDAITASGRRIQRRIGFLTTAAFDAYASTDGAKLAALSDLFTAALSVRLGVRVTADPVNLTAPRPFGAGPS